MQAGAFMLLALAPSLPSGYSFGAGLLVLVALVTLRRDWTTLAWRHEDRWVFGVTAAFAITWTIQAAADDARIGDIDRPIRFVLALLCFAALVRHPPRASAVWLGAALGALAAAALAVVQVYGLGAERAEGWMRIAIQFGNLGMALGLLCLVAAVMPSPERGAAWRALMIAGTLAGALASFLSGSRGGWLVLPVALLVLVALTPRPQRAGTTAWTAAMVTVSVVLLLFLARPQVVDRVDQAWHETHAYVVQGQTDSSIGIRLTQWRLAWEMSLHRPVLGWGQRGVQERWQEMADAGEVSRHIGGFRHVHNEYLDVLVKRGFVGLLTLLALYAVHLWASVRAIRRTGPADLTGRALATAQLLFTLAYALFGLTQVSMSHNSGVMVYAFGSLILYAAVRPWSSHPNERTPRPD